MNVWTSRAKGRSIIGQPTIRTVHRQRGGNVTIILALSPQRGIEHHSFHVGGTTSSVFLDFFNALWKSWVGKPMHLYFLDNAPCYRATVALSPNHTVKFLPPDSPVLTPIEKAFSAFKWAFKNKLTEPATQSRFPTSSKLLQTT